MPNRAKLTTRSITTTTVTADALPKNAALTNNELDSNFINLRDQTFSIVGDDSAGIDIRAGDTIKFLGAGGATITSSGDTITVTAGGGGGGAITFVGDDSTGTAVSTGETFKIAGGTGITTAVSGDVLTITNTGGSIGGDLSVVGSTILAPSNGDLGLQTSGTGYVHVKDKLAVAKEIYFDDYGAAEVEPPGNGERMRILDEEIDINSGRASIDSFRIWSRAGTGSQTYILDVNSSGDSSDLGHLKIYGLSYPSTDGTNGQVLTTDGAGLLNWTTVSGGSGAITFVGDDSTGTAVNTGETFKIAGGTGITTAVSGDVLTITNTGGGGGTGNFTITGTTISAETTNADITITASGTGNLNVDMDTLRIGDLNSSPATITTNGADNLLLTTSSGSHGQIEITTGPDANITISPHNIGQVALNTYTTKIGKSGSDATLTANTGGDLILNTNSGTNSGSITIADGVNGNISITPNGTGSVVIDGISHPQADGTNGQVLTTNGSGVLSFSTPTTGTVTSITAGTGLTGGTITTTGTIAIDSTVATLTGSQILTNKSISLTTNTITGTLAEFNTALSGDDFVSLTGAETLTNKTLTSPVIAQVVSVSNGAIELAPNGTGDVQLTADTVRVGDANANATITTNGTGDLTLNTNSGTNSGSIVIADGVNGKITVAVNGTGLLDLHKSFDSTNFPQTPASGNTNWAAATSTSYVGTRMLYSNLTQGDITQPEDRVRANTRVVSIKHPNDSTTYNDTDYLIQNTDIVVLDINGQSFGSTLTGSRGAGVRGAANTVILKNTAGGTKTAPNLIGGSAFVEMDSAHTGDLTVVNAIGFRSAISCRGNTGEFNRMTNSFGFLAEGVSVGGSGTSGTNRFVTNEHGFFSQGSTSASLSTNYYGFYANTGAVATNKYAFYSADDAYLSRLGTIEGYREKQNALTSSSTITVDADLAPVHTVTLATNTQFGIANLSTGQTVTLIITQDGTGSRTATFTSDTSVAVKFAGGTPTLSTAANAIDIVKIYNDGANFLGTIEKAFA